MDDKVFIFLILIPAIVFFLCWLFLRKVKNGKFILLALIGLVILINVLYLTVFQDQPNSGNNFSSGIKWVATLYLELFVCLIFSIVYWSIRKGK